VRNADRKPKYRSNRTEPDQYIAVTASRPTREAGAGADTEEEEEEVVDTIVLPARCTPSYAQNADRKPKYRSSRTVADPSTARIATGRTGLPGIRTTGTGVSAFAGPPAFLYFLFIIAEDST